MPRPAIRPRFDRKRRDPVQRSPLMNVGPIYAYASNDDSSSLIIVFDGPLAFSNWPTEWVISGGVTVFDIEHIGQNAVFVRAGGSVTDQTVDFPDSAEVTVLNGQPYRPNNLTIQQGSI